MLLTIEGTFPRAQYFIFELLEFGRDIPFGVFQRLPAYIVGRRFVGLSFADLNVITVHPVVAESQGRNTGARFLA